MKDIIDSLVKLRIVSVIVILLLLYFCVDLLKSSKTIDSPQSVGGFILLLVAILIAIYIAIDYLIKEHYEKIIEVQQVTLEKMANTNTAAQKSIQEAYKTPGTEISQKYSKLTETVTDSSGGV